ncbi:MAG TPA: DUF1178 family protein [Rhizobiales bacterium]|nr:DUF1178 family protein [Hyphomicrobiales bacterium]
MIQYALKCAEGHTFDSWFQSAAAFEKLISTGMLTCAVCGGTQVQKAVMMPQIRPARKAAEPGPPATPASASLREPVGPAERELAELRRKIEQNSDYVGKDFASEARAMHDGDVPLRSIYGEARADEAKKLIEDGVPVAPLPFIPARKTN